MPNRSHRPGLPTAAATKVCAGLGRWLQSNARPGAIDIEDGLDLTAAHYANEAYLRFTVSHWSLVQSGGRYQLYKWYQKRSGGWDLVIDFNLPPEGIYLTIDRIESGASGGPND